MKVFAFTIKADSQSLNPCLKVQENKAAIIAMKVNPLVMFVSFLLTFVVMIMIGLHQNYTWKSNDKPNDTALAFGDHKLRNQPQKTEVTVPDLKHEPYFDKYKCLSQLKFDVKAKIMMDPHERCLPYPLRDDKTGNTMATLVFCAPFLTKYVIAKSATECEHDGYWVYNPRGCMRQFVPAMNEQALKVFMRKPGIGFSKSRPVGRGDSRLVFFSDTCTVDEQKQKLNCRLVRQGDDQGLSYPLTPNLIPYGPYDVDFAAIACRDP